MAVKKYRYVLLILLVVFINAGCDQGTKHYARKNFKDQGTIRVLDDFFVIRYTENDGGFLSLASALPVKVKKIILLYFPAAVLIFLAVYLVRNGDFNLFETLCLASVIGGGASNLYDRIFFDGLVTDFLHFSLGPLRTGILNFADMSITFGVILFMLSMLAKERRKTREARG